jgi:hypothetical protein
MEKTGKGNQKIMNTALCYVHSHKGSTDLTGDSPENCKSKTFDKD